MKNIVFVLLVILFLTSYSKPNKLKRIWQYSSKSSDLTIEIIKQNDSTVEANHSFVAFNGNRIDFPDEEGASIILTKYNDDIYTGTFDCAYSNEKLIVSVHFYKKYLIFKFLDSHPFLQDSIIFHKKY